MEWWGRKGSPLSPHPKLLFLVDTETTAIMLKWW